MRRKRWWTWRPWRPEWERWGLAPELSHGTMIAPWLSRTAGRPVRRPGPERWAAVRRIEALSIQFVPNTELFDVANLEADAAIKGFVRQVSLMLDGRLTAAGKARLFDEL